MRAAWCRPCLRYGRRAECGSNRIYIFSGNACKVPWPGETAGLRHVMDPTGSGNRGVFSPPAGPCVLRSRAFRRRRNAVAAVQDPERWRIPVRPLPVSRVWISCRPGGIPLSARAPARGNRAATRRHAGWLSGRRLSGSQKKRRQRRRRVTGTRKCRLLGASLGIQSPAAFSAAFTASTNSASAAPPRRSVRARRRPCASSRTRALV